MPRGTPVDGDTATFLRAILTRPHQVGAIAPSSIRLARVAAAQLPDPTHSPSLGAGSTVVELGPGGGVITDQLHARLAGHGRLFAVEINPTMAAHLRASRPWLHVIQGDATHLTELLAEHGVHQVDAVISALPWSVFDAHKQHTVVDQISRVLHPDGLFASVVTCAAVPLPGARRLRRILPEVFGNVVRSRVVLRNLPPAFWLLCRKPTGHD